jgi:hypothetical protein
MEGNNAKIMPLDKSAWLSAASLQAACQCNFFSFSRWHKLCRCRKGLTNISFVGGLHFGAMSCIIVLSKGVQDELH